MRAFLARRLIQSALVVFLVATIAFFLIHLAPGDPFSATLENPRIPESVRQQWRAVYGLDRPLAEQYWRWLTNIARGELGWSFSLNRPVGEAIAAAIPNTLLLMSVALAGSFALGLGLGVVQAARRGSMADRTLSAGSLFFYSMPDFWLALLVVLVFAYGLGWFPAGGTVDPVMYDYLGPWERVVDRLRHLVLPAATLTLLTAAAIARYQRSAILDVIHDEFVRTARAKGLSERRVLLRHVLRNALLPVITLLGLALPALLGGAVFIERVFAWPGMGLLVVDAITTRDYPLVVGAVVVGGILVSLGSLIADLLYAAADPRLRHAT